MNNELCKHLADVLVERGAVKLAAFAVFALRDGAFDKGLDRLREFWGTRYGTNAAAQGVTLEDCLQEAIRRAHADT